MREAKSSTSQMFNSNVSTRQNNNKLTQQIQKTVRAPAKFNSYENQVKRQQATQLEEEFKQREQMSQKIAQDEMTRRKAKVK